MLTSSLKVLSAPWTYLSSKQKLTENMATTNADQDATLFAQVRFHLVLEAGLDPDLVNGFILDRLTVLTMPIVFHSAYRKWGPRSLTRLRPRHN